MSKISPCLWFDGQAEQAARFYVSIVPDSRIDAVVRSTVDWPNGKVGDVILVEFTLAGSSYQALNAGPEHPFTPAISLSLACQDQAEVDRAWDALLAGGKPVQCGWLEDRYGVSWQIVPQAFLALMRDGDPAGVKRAMTAMMAMVKLDMPTLEKAYAGP